MDPWDCLHELPDGIDCAVCRRRVPVARIRLLARRDQIAFVELDCDACGSVALGIVVAPDGQDGRVAMDHPGYGELSPAEEARRAHSPPIGPADVEQMRSFLAAHHGGLQELLGSDSGGPSASHGR